MAARRVYLRGLRILGPWVGPPGFVITAPGEAWHSRRDRRLACKTPSPQEDWDNRASSKCPVVLLEGDQYMGRWPAHMPYPRRPPSQTRERQRLRDEVTTAAARWIHTISGERFNSLEHWRE
eukprot:8906148-Pyramimonas_sp.AAC.1